jgi:threonine dehydrogenase-like Zn-dependent dehydrogenase
MLSLVATPGTAQSTRLEDRPPPRAGRDVLVRTLEIGVCGTDREIDAGLLGSPPPGSDTLVLGHEVIGCVERGAAGWRAGDLVVATVRRPCGHCENCDAGYTEACTTGEMPERGIHRADGFGAELFVEQAANLIGVPVRLGRLGLLTEPASICVRALRQTLVIGHRQAWRPRRAIVVGAGAIGILTTVLLRLRGLETWTLSREAENSPQADLVRRTGARYVSVAGVEPASVAAEVGPDILIEATGDADVVHQLIGATARNGVVCLLGNDGRRRAIAVDSWILGRDYISSSRALFGSVNAARDDWPAAVEALVAADRAFPRLLDDLITRREPPDRFAAAIQPGGVKTAIVFAG